MKAYTLAGLTDTVTDCGCCNRKNLKKTVVLSLLDELGEHEDYHFFGTGCASKALGWNQGRKIKTNSEINKLAKNAIMDSINDEIDKIKNNGDFILVGGFLHLKSVWIENGTHAESIDATIAKYPIMAYNFARINLDEAAKILF